jgi:sigma-B regulation protein RsbU (phosphoserine phosphatase)
MTDQLLARVPLFTGLPPAALAQLAAVLSLRQASDGQILFRENEHGEHFYVVVEGQIDVIKALGTPAERLLASRGPGEFVGEMSLFNPDGLRTATVRARGPARLLEMTRADFDGLLQRYPTLAYAMVRVLSQRMSAGNNQRIAELLEKNAELEAAYAALKAAQAQIIESEKLARELELAHEIQVGMLPRTLPALPGYSFGARTLPARTVGGDIYDCFTLPDGCLGLLVADVSGKGLPAAIFAGTIKALLRAEASRPGSPGEVLQRANTHLLGMNESGLFVTAIYAVLHPASGQLSYARAGHELPLLAEAGRPSRQCPGGRGQPLGLFQPPQLDEQIIPLAPGAAVLIYSDGVTDARNPAGDMLGAEALRASLDEPDANASAQTLCDRLLQNVLDFQSNAEQHDDITLVAVQRQLP